MSRSVSFFGKILAVWFLTFLESSDWLFVNSLSSQVSTFSTSARRRRTYMPDFFLIKQLCKEQYANTIFWDFRVGQWKIRLWNTSNPALKIPNEFSAVRHAVLRRNWKFFVPHLIVFLWGFNKRSDNANTYAWCQASAGKWMNTALFWVITQRIVIISYRRFGTTHLKGSRILDSWRWNWQVVPKRW
jgi:hypothetical protein